MLGRPPSMPNPAEIVAHGARELHGSRAQLRSSACVGQPEKPRQPDESRWRAQVRQPESRDRRRWVRQRKAPPRTGASASADA